MYKVEALHLKRRKYTVFVPMASKTLYLNYGKLAEMKIQDLCRMSDAFLLFLLSSLAHHLQQTLRFLESICTLQCHMLLVLSGNISITAASPAASYNLKLQHKTQKRIFSSESVHLSTAFSSCFYLLMISSITLDNLPSLARLSARASASSTFP